MNKIQSENYYDILGIEKSADNNEIKKAYRKLAVKYHPDKNIDFKDISEYNFKKINEAYSVLSDKQKKAEYDYGNFNNFQSMSSNDANDIFNTFFSSTGTNLDIPMFNTFNNVPTSTFFSFQTKTTSTNNFSSINTSIFDQFNNTSIGHDIFKIGTYIIIKNIHVDGLNKYNNTNAKIIKYDTSKKKYLVETNNNDSILIPQKYIQQILTITIIDLVRYQYMNNQICTANEFCKKTHRFKVAAFDSTYSLKQKNVIINNDTCVQIYNLKNNTALNNTWCTILLFDKITKKYLVDVGDNKHVKISVENIIF